jgi:integrase
MPDTAQSPTDHAEPVAKALFRVRIVKMSDGERLPLVVDQRGLPVPAPNQWSLYIRRPQVQQNTLIDELRTIAHVYEWATLQSIDLNERLDRGNGLTPTELNTLYQNLRYVSAVGRKTAHKRLTNVRDIKVVSGTVHATRVGYAREYLVWGMERLLYRLDVSDPRVSIIRERRDNIRRIASGFQRESSDRKASRIGLTREQRARLLEIVDPGYARNPFNRPVRFRNWVIILLLLTFGYRRGEILKLYVSDVNVKGRSPSITLVRRPGDINDPRAEEPSVKTLGRRIPLTTEMARVLDLFIVYHRPQFPNADMSPFLLFSQEGNPLALRSENAIIERIVDAFPEFEGLLTPHVLRYTYNDMLDEASRNSGLDRETRKSAQNYLNGWSVTSDQGSLYTRRAIEQRAGEISLLHQRSLFT